MTLSGFSMCRNAETLYYPLKQSILSALPLVDEFVVAVGKGSESDRTLELLRSIDSPKLRIIVSEWDLEAFPRGMIHARQTDLAKDHCNGDWLLYLQADEVIHENDHEAVLEVCRRFQHDDRVEGLLFSFRHFWGDYRHLVDGHGWYPKEIRVVRNRPDIHSWQSAQSFRVIPGFDGKSYRSKEGTRKLRVAEVNAGIYHYGWVRPPAIMAKKVRELDRIHSHERNAYPEQFDYGNMSRLTPFTGTHPEVMAEWIARMDWQDQLRFSDAGSLDRKPFKHERLRYRLLSWVERNMLRNREIAGFRNYDLLT